MFASLPFPAGARCSSADAAGVARVRRSDRGEAERALLADVFTAGGPASPVAHIKRRGERGERRAAFQYGSLLHTD